MMKFNWRVLLAVVVLVGAIALGVNSLLPQSYSGTDLNFGVGGVPVRVTNPSDEALPVQFVSAGTRSFSVSSTIEDVSGRSTREGSGSSAINSYDFELPPGESEFTITSRGANVNFVADTETRLEATIQPLRESSGRTTVIVVAVIVLGALFYISRTTDHEWISRVRGTSAFIEAAQPTTTSAAAHGQGSVARSVGDNRANIGD